MPRTLPVDHLSPSQISTYSQCPRRYYLQYVEGIRGPASGAMLRGTAVHAGVELNYQQKLTTRQDLPVAVVERAAADAFKKGLSAAEFHPRENRSTLQQQVVDMARVYHENVAPRIQPLMVERSVDVDMAGVPVPVRGVIDLVDDTEALRDLKTTGRAPDPSSAQESDQLAHYALAYRQVTGSLPRVVSLDYIIAGSTPRFWRQECTVGQGRIDQWESTVRRTTADILAGRFGAQPNRLCSWCGVQSLCSTYSPRASVSAPARPSPKPSQTKAAPAKPRATTPPKPESPRVTAPAAAAQPASARASASPPAATPPLVPARPNLPSPPAVQPSVPLPVYAGASRRGGLGSVIGAIVVLGICLLAASLLVGGGALQGETIDQNPASTSGSKTGSSANIATLAKFDQVEIGMSYEEVRQIMGVSGTELVRSEGASSTSVVYMWLGADGRANMNVTFLGDVVLTKAQSGLQ